MCELIEKDDFIYVDTEYYTPFITAAKKLNGSWVIYNNEKKMWKFPSDIKEEVENILIDLYGYKQEKVTIKLIFNNKYVSYFERNNIELFGRVLFNRKYSSNNVYLHKSVSILKGGFDEVGGSKRYPEVSYPEDDSIFLIRNVPINLLDDIDLNIFSYEIKETKEKITKYSSLSTHELLEIKKEIDLELKKREK